MGINFKELFQQFISALSSFISTELPGVVNPAMEYIQGLDDRLSKLNEYFMNGDISKKFLLDRLEDEKNILLSELLSYGVISGQIIEDAINKALEIVTSAIISLTNGDKS